MPGIGYSLLIENQPAPADIVDAIEHVDVERDLGLADVLRLELGVALSDDGDRWTIADDGVFARLTNVRVLVTLGLGLPKVVFDGYVAETSLELSEDPGASRLTVVALDATALMNLDERVREWPNMPDSVIATTIFAEHGLVPVVGDTQPIRSLVDTTVIQRDTDIRFLRHLAHRNGFDVYVQPTPVPGLIEGHFHAPSLDLPPQGVLSVNLGEMTNVRSFTLRHQLLRPAAAEVASVDASTVQSQAVSVNTTALTELGRMSLLGGDRPRATALRNRGLAASGELQVFAQASVDRSSWAITVEGELETAVYGDALDTGQTVLVRGAGSSHSGTYFVERVHHVIEGERYTQRFTLRRNAVAPLGTEVYAQDGAIPG
jgi:phage protein D